MKYLCLVYREDASDDTFPDETCESRSGEVFDHREELMQSGHLVVSCLLQSARAATTVRVHNGRVSITDGPYTESVEQLAGFYLIEARDLNDAIRVVSKMPPARHGGMEIRPLRELRQSLRPGSI